VSDSAPAELEVSESTRAQLAVIVLNWNGADDTLPCLQSLRRSVVPLHVIVVDNGSTDDGVDRIETSGLANDVIRADENLGYAEGNNVGLRLAIHEQFPFVAVLNNDTVIDPRTFGDLLEHLQHGQHRALSPDVRYLDRPSESWFAGGVVDRGWPRHLQACELSGDDGVLRPTTWLSGCCIIARRETWERVGLFDDSLFILFEDGDWSMRATRSGVALYVATESTILHRVSSAMSRGPSSFLGGFYFVRNGLHFEARYFKRHLPRFAFQWLVRPAPALLRTGRLWELMFRWFGALGFIVGLRGRAPRLLERLARRLAS
jgi:GT2 family glycosyltransferase